MVLKGVFEEHKQKAFRIIADTLAVILIYLVVAYMINPEDVFFIRDNFNYFIIVLAVVTLFHGFIAGIIAMIVFFIVAHFVYPTFPTYHFLFFLALMLVFGEAHHLWNTIIVRLRKEKSYLEEKVKNLRESLFLLKLSHDQIEKNYVLKPMSIRRALAEINKMIVEKSKKLFQNFMMLLANNTGLESGSLYLKRGDEFVELASVGEGAELDFNDPMLKEALETRETTYLSVSSLRDNVYSKYLAVIPILDEKRELKALLLITEMPFSELNKDNLLKANVFLVYLFGKLAAADKYSYILQKYPDIDLYLVREIDVLTELYKKYGIESNIVVFEMDKEDAIHGIFIDIEGKIRGFDYAVRYSFGNKEMLIVLLPFTSSENVKGFLNRIKRDILRTYGKDVEVYLKHRIIPIGNFPLERIINKILKGV
jgi:hypothetical protein